MQPTQGNTDDEQPGIGSPGLVRVLDLFSGIGGFSLGLERAGMRTVAFCEIDPYCRAVLAKHWPDVPCHDDIRTIQPPQAEVITAGWPCQDLSIAGAGAGLRGKRSGLWDQVRGLLAWQRPRYAILENVSALRSRGLSEVLWDLAEIGYDAEWHCIPASHVGAPQKRDRIWIVAYPQFSVRGRPEGFGWRSPKPPILTSESWRTACTTNVQWLSEPGVGRVADGVPNGAHRLRSIGNSFVPQIAEVIGRAIMRAEA